MAGVPISLLRTRRARLLATGGTIAAGAVLTAAIIIDGPDASSHPSSLSAGSVSHSATPSWSHSETAPPTAQPARPTDLPPTQKPSRITDPAGSSGVPPAPPKRTSDSPRPVPPVNPRPAATAQTGNLPAAAATLLELVNGARRAGGLGALTLDSRLVTMAQQHNVEMARYDQLTHQAPGEPSLLERRDRVGFTGVVSENVAFVGYWTSYDDAARRAHALLMNSPAHHENIMRAQARTVGIAVYHDSAHGRVWVTEDFGDA